MGSDQAVSSFKAVLMRMPYGAHCQPLLLRRLLTP